MSSLSRAIAALPVLLYLTAPVQASHQHPPKTFMAQIQQRSSAASSADTYDRAMRIGYTASQHRDYQTALINFKRALQQRPGDPYATKAIQNVQRYLLVQQGAASAPWSKPALPPSEVPAVLLQQWRQADNRSSCAALAPVSLGQGAGATPRAADFSGGWVVAYDKPGLPGRSPDASRCTDCGQGAFGIAGTGLEQAGTEDHGQMAAGLAMDLKVAALVRLLRMAPTWPT